MSNLTYEQIRNLENDGYTITERGGKTEILKETPSGTIRYKMENGVLHQIDSYFGDVTNRDEHDRFTVKYDGDGKPSGHGFNHKGW